jgi:molybdopterin converting factor small subunit
VHVRYFAGAQAAAGTPEQDLVLPAPATLEKLISELVAQHGHGLARVLAASSYIVDESVSGPEAPLADGARVDVLPPFAGG